MVYYGFLRGHSKKSVFDGVWEDFGSVACDVSYNFSWFEYSNLHLLKLVALMYVQVQN